MLYRTLALFCVVTLASANAMSEQRVTDLVGASIVELENLKQHSEQKASALKTLVEATGLDMPVKLSKKPAVAEDPVRKERGANSKTPTKPRKLERSQSRIPSALVKSMGAQSFDRIRQKLIKAPDNSVVLEQLANYVKQYSHHQEARLLLARGQILNGEAELALQTLEALLTIDEPGWQPSFWIGSSYLALGHLDLAKLYLDAALDQHGDSSELWVQVAVLEQEEGRHASAIQYLDVAGQLEPGRAEVHLNRAYSLEHLGESKKALLSYRQFLVSQKTSYSTGLRTHVMSRIAAISSCLDKRTEPGRESDSVLCAS